MFYPSFGCLLCLLLCFDLTLFLVLLLIVFVCVGSVLVFGFGIIVIVGSFVLVVCALIWCAVAHAGRTLRWAT